MIYVRDANVTADIELFHREKPLCKSVGEFFLPLFFSHAAFSASYFNSSRDRRFWRRDLAVSRVSQAETRNVERRSLRAD